MDTAANDEKRQKVSTEFGEKRSSLDWSNLCTNVLLKIFEILRSPIDYHRAKTVCSNWYSVSKTCVDRPPRLVGPPPCLITRKERFDRRSISWKKEDRLKRSNCMATSDNWLLMTNNCHLDFYILNLLSMERINLPPMTLPTLGQQVTFTTRERDNSGYECDPGSRQERGYFVGTSCKDFVSKAIIKMKSSAVLSVDKSTGSYVVAWIYRQRYLFSYKKGNDSWWSLNPKSTESGFLDVAYKKSKLYVLTTDHHIKIFDFSGDSPKEVEDIRNPYMNHPFRFVEQSREYIWKRKICIGKSGEVMIILGLKEVKSDEKLLFYIFKMNFESCEWEKVDSIGDEILSFGHGVTIRGDGINNDSIYFVDDVWPDQDHDHRASNCGVYNIATSEIKWLDKEFCFYVNKTQWFIPKVAH